MEPANHGPGTSDQNLWEFAGWGQSEQIRDLGDDVVEVHSIAGHGKHQLGQWQATAICGTTSRNDGVSIAPSRRSLYSHVWNVPTSSFSPAQNAACETPDARIAPLPATSTLGPVVLSAHRPSLDLRR